MSKAFNNNKKKRHKRGNGEGMLWKDGLTGRYRWRLNYIDPLTGKKATANLSDMNRTELGHKISSFISSLEHDCGNFETMTLKQLFNEWLSLKRATKKEKTVKNYEDIFNRHILPEMGDFRIRMLRREHVQKLLNAKAEKWSPSTVASIRRVFRACLNYAVREKRIEENPVRFTEIAEVKQKIPAVLDYDKLKRLFRLAYTAEFLPCTSQPASLFMRKGLFVSLCVSICLGTRRGETFALSWQNIEGNIITINQNVQEINGKRKLITPKTRRSIRCIGIPETMVTLLEDWKMTQQAYAKKFDGYYKNADNLVFTNSTGGIVSSSNLYRRWWNPLRIAVGLPNFRWHDLRSASLSYYASRGTEMSVVSALAGHSSVKTTLMYYIGILGEQERRRLQVAEDLATMFLPTPINKNNQSGV